MTVQDDFIFFTDGTGSAASAPLVISRGASSIESVAIQASGTFTGSVVIEGVADLQQENGWVSVSGINMTDFSVAQTITKPGIYSYGVENFAKLRARLDGVGGSVTVFARGGRTV